MPVSKSLIEEIVYIQQKLSVPKNKKNNFGNYRYRSAEDILEALKGLLHDRESYLNISDEIMEVGGRVYVKATATLFDKSGDCISSQGWAREQESRAGMDSSQITGAASSYARKYALNGLFAIDDTKDADDLHGIELDDKKECSECKKVIEDDVINYSLNRYGKKLCRDCQKGV